MTVERELGDLNARVTALEKSFEDIHEDTKAIRSTLDQAKGSWRTMVGLSTLSGALGATAHWFFANFPFGR